MKHKYILALGLILSMLFSAFSWASPRLQYTQSTITLEVKGAGEAANTTPSWGKYFEKIAVYDSKSGETPCYQNAIADWGSKAIMDLNTGPNNRSCKGNLTKIVFTAIQGKATNLVLKVQGAENEPVDRSVTGCNGKVVIDKNKTSYHGSNACTAIAQ